MVWFEKVQFAFMFIRILPACALLLLLPGPAWSGGTPYYDWQAKDLAIAKPLGGLTGNAQRGRAVVIDRDRGNCLACHRLPIPDEPMQGTVGPPLVGIGARLSEAQLRLRVVNEQLVNPATIMPRFYARPGTLNRPLPAYNTTILSAQDIEDVVAYLKTLR
ncbi:MAG: sulfur oxidation c-type cytochrome SoxX [Gammaproteobacteria bacterium]|jgi:L-cysteine S-thiosulfotransferase